ncbi:leucyl aminopeptidase family protein [Cohnella silvisoli]|uniref:Probable cytosol aminopeptidase n=1 Tax=Cohnella silvisoli TaxID=2873699 RepID=A0ABV1KVT8_9BACL|nr:leucyl aminopeptidase family protein [Cohnella silvisoli]MCD9023560.1 leucyl aminopeptidase family protein [Cohnella silvisoli]
MSAMERADDSVQTLLFPVYQESLQRLAELPQIGQLLHSAALRPHMGARNAVTWFYGRQQGEPDIVVVGLGDKASFHPARIREAAGNAGRMAVKERRLSVNVSFQAMLNEEKSSDLEAEAVTAWVEGWKLGTYSFDKHKKKTDKPEVPTLHFEQETSTIIQEAIRLGEIRAEGTMWARDLANEPANHLRPFTLADKVKERFAGTGVDVKVFAGEELERLDFAGVIAVGKGSVFPPAFIELRYCTDDSKPLTALIGKGITFDTGGVSLKRDNDISDMRMDMAGAAGVLGALDIVVKSGASANLAVLVPTAENVIAGNALLPSDVIRYANGLTVQVGNTDSEGRLILADALIHAHRIGAAEAIDLATLTYSVVGALGTKIAGVFGDDELALTLKHAGEPFGEKVWQLPLVDEYESYLDSAYADVCNISNGDGGGAITAALFLRKFVDPSLRWAHIDMNGPKDSSSAKGEQAIGATGFGARMLASYIIDRV